MLLSLLLAAQAANVPELPRDIPPQAARYSVLSMGLLAGQQAVWTLPDGTVHAFFQFNDRGRGPKTWSTLTLRDGLPVEEHITGNDYMKEPVDDRYAVRDGVASWKSKAETGEMRLAGPAFYFPLHAPPFDAAVLAKALLSHGGSLALLPEGAARIEKLLTHGALTLYAITGLGYEPALLWLDGKNDFFASVSAWSTVIPEGQEGRAPALLRLQDGAEAQRARGQAARLAHRHAGKVLIHDANVFDAETATFQPHHDVLIEGNRILSVAPSRAEVPSGAELIDARGKTLLPGLWDMHAHVGSGDGLLNLAAGVTAVRDMANDVDDLAARRKRIEAGQEVGTRIFAAGFIDGRGPYQGPSKALVSTQKEALDWVDRYAALGYLQIKLYSSLPVAFVPAIAEAAHRKGMRLSGHVPAFMTAADAVRAGYDEIQHLNMLLLNFMPDVQDTRTPARFIEPARRTAGLVSTPRRCTTSSRC